MYEVLLVIANNIFIKSASAGRSAVIDNTNVDEATRRRYIDIAHRLSVRVRCFVMNTTLEHARHNEVV